MHGVIRKLDDAEYNIQPRQYVILIVRQTVRECVAKKQNLI